MNQFIKFIAYPDTSSLGISPANASAISFDPIFAIHWRARLKYVLHNVGYPCLEYYFFITEFCYIFKYIVIYLSYIYKYFSYLPDMNWISRIEVILDRLVDKINQITVLADQH
jgi:hypothetical protein